MAKIPLHAYYDQKFDIFMDQNKFLSVFFTS